VTKKHPSEISGPVTASESEHPPLKKMDGVWVHHGEPDGSIERGEEYNPKRLKYAQPIAPCAVVAPMT
jgi:hypothetical protein